MPAWRTQLQRRRPDRHESGQALLELALVVPILVLIAMAIFQFAFVLESQMGLTNAVREAARRAAAAAPGDPVWADLQTWTLDELNGTGGTPGLLAQNVQGYDPSRLWTAPYTALGMTNTTSPAISFCSYDVAGLMNYRIDVTVRYEHPIFFVLMGFATDAIDGTANGEWDLGASAQMRLENVDPAVASDPGACGP